MVAILVLVALCIGLPAALLYTLHTRIIPHYRALQAKLRTQQARASDADARGLSMGPEESAMYLDISVQDKQQTQQQPEAEREVELASSPRSCGNSPATAAREIELQFQLQSPSAQQRGLQSVQQMMLASAREERRNSGSASSALAVPQSWPARSRSSYDPSGAAAAASPVSPARPSRIRQLSLATVAYSSNTTVSAQQGAVSNGTDSPAGGLAVRRIDAAPAIIRADHAAGLSIAISPMQHPPLARARRLAAFLWFAFMGRSSDNEYARFLNSFGHLFLFYSDAFWFLGPVSLLRKAALVAVLQFGGSVRGVLASLLLGAFLLLYAQKAPFRVRATTLAAEVCSFSLLLLLLVVSGQVDAPAVPPLVALAVIVPWLVCLLVIVRSLAAARARARPPRMARDSLQ
jgi:hypothetical protein